MLLLLAPVERVLHPHGGSVVEVQTSPSVPEYRYSFRMNESHTLPITRRRSPLHHNRPIFGGQCAWALLACDHLLQGIRKDGAFLTSISQGLLAKGITVKSEMHLQEKGKITLD